MSLYNKEMRLYRAALSKQMAMASWTELPLWSDHIGFIGTGDGKYPRSIAMGSAQSKLLKPTGKPIEVLSNFQHEGGVTMDIPVLYPLTEKPVYGDIQLLGTEESRKIAYKTVRINQVRKGTIIKDGMMSDQVLKRPEIQKQLMSSAQEDLTDLNKRWNAYQPYNAFLYRYSENIFAPTSEGGLGITKQSHPNFFVAGVGKVAWSDTPATYEGNIATALASLTNSSASYFSTKTIESMVYNASRLKIRPSKFGPNGAPFYHIVISQAQAYQLLQDDKWIAAQKDATPRDTNSPLFTGLIMGVYRGAIIYIDQNIPDIKLNGDTGFTTSLSTTGTTAGIQYGNVNPLADPLSSSVRKVAILFGGSAIACGYASELKFKEETWDYENKKTEGSSMIVGYERADIYDYDGYFGSANGFKENTSSLVAATYSPDTITW